MSAVVGWHTADGERDGGLTAGDPNPLDAANECPHGALPSDRKRICDCWPQQARMPAPDLMGALAAAQTATTSHDQEERMATAAATNGTGEEERARAMHAVYWPEDPEQAKTLAQVGEQFGLPSGRVRQAFARFDLPVRGPGSRPGKPAKGPITTAGEVSNAEQDRRIKAIGERARRPGHDTRVRTPEQSRFFAERVRETATAELEELDAEEKVLRQNLEDELAQLQGERESIEAVLGVLDRQ